MLFSGVLLGVFKWFKCHSQTLFFNRLVNDYLSAIFIVHFLNILLLKFCIESVVSINHYCMSKQRRNKY